MSRLGRKGPEILWRHGNMSEGKSTKCRAPGARGRMTMRGMIWAAAGLSAVALCAAAAYRFGRAAMADSPGPAVGEAAPVAGRFDPAALLGRWQRPDGGYVIEVSRVLPEGRLEAKYFNPRPIRVSRAEVRQWDQVSGFYLELQDRGYPGSTYNLAYRPGQDCLAGWYYQAAIQETFEVMFKRVGAAPAAGVKRAVN